jgi:hypothetical protein
MEHSNVDKVTVRYADFIRICNVLNPANFYGFRVEINGLYTILPGQDVILMSKERAALSWHPTGVYSQPALPLPCTVAQLRTFVSEAGLKGCIYEDAIAELPALEVPVSATGQSIALPRQRAQESNILMLLRSRHFDPLHLPVRGKGAIGTKAGIRAAALLLKPTIFTKNSFDKAWQRLRSDGQIVGGE